jgi:hypothetical protein
MSIGATLVASLLATLSQPRTWPIALAAFLVRGGILVVLAPIVVVPSAIGVANAVTPAVTTFVFGGLSTGLVALAAGTSALLLVWLVLGGLFAAAAELELVARVARDDAVAVEAHVRTIVMPTPGRAARVLIARLIAHLPTALALAWGTARVVEVAYRELTQPLDVTIPLALRVAASAPEAIVAVVSTWVLGEIVGAIAARRVAFYGAGVLRAVGGGLRRVLRHPLRAIVLYAVPAAALLGVLIPSALAAATGWDAVRAALTGGDGPILTVLTLIVFVGLWVGGLVLTAAMTAWRAAAWTVDAAVQVQAVSRPSPSEDFYEDTYAEA